ncbi:MAG: alpha/beta hydrolase [Dehalococcoidia bacterium]
MRGYATTPEGQVHYIEEGAGEPLLLLHQTGSSRQFWRLMPLLARRYRVIALDNLGAGNSDPLPPNVQINDMARSIIHAMDDLGIGRAHVFGFHTGNKIGTEMAAAWPERVAGLILCGNSHSIMADHEELNAALGAVVASTVRQYPPEPSGAHLLKQWAAEFSRLSATWWATNDYEGAALTPDLFERRRERIIDALQLRDNHEVYRAIFAFDLGARMRDIKAPTLIVEVRVPSEAHLAPQGPKLIRLVPNSRLATVTLPAAGMAVEVKADEMAGLVLDFLATLPPA